MKLLCSDFDGTLAINGIVSKENIEAVKKFQASGNKFGIVTGRSQSILQSKLQAIDIHPDFLIVSNGAVTINGDTVQVNGKLTQGCIDKILEVADRYRVSAAAITDGFKNEILKTKQRFSIKSWIMRKGSSLYLNSQKVDRDQVVAVYLKDFNTKRCREISEELIRIFGDSIEVKINTGINIDITAAGMTKENAIKNLADNFPGVEIYTVGDSLNDIGMVKEFYGFAMKSGSDAVKKVAKKETDSVARVIYEIMEGNV